MKKLTQFWNRLPDGVRRVVHTAWEVVLPTLLSNLLVARSSADVKGAFVVTGAVFLAWLKAYVLHFKDGLR